MLKTKLPKFEKYLKITKTVSLSSSKATFIIKEIHIFICTSAFPYKNPMKSTKNPLFKYKRIKLERMLKRKICKTLL